MFQMDQPDCSTFSKPGDCRLIVIGLGGVGKTTLINQLCNTKFVTNYEKNSCPIEKEQYGSFKVTNHERQFDLIDMVGINYETLGQWQKAMHGKSNVHGVIFYISATNPKDVSQADLPHFAEYCDNLSIPVLYLYYDIWPGPNQLFESNHQPLLKVLCKPGEVTGEVIITNIDPVKESIAETFINKTKLCELMDPVQCCRLVQETKEENKKLEANIRELQEEQQKTKVESDKRIGELYNDKKILHDQLEQKNKEIAELDNDQKILRCELEQKSKQIDELDNEKKNLSCELQQKSKQIDELLEQHNRNSSTIEKMVENNIGLKQKNDRTNFELGESKKREESLNRKIANMTGKTEELMSQRAKFQAKSEQLEKDRNRSHQENGELINRNQTIMNEIRELLNQWRKDLPKVTEMPDSKSLKVRAKLHLSSKSLKNLLPGYAYWVVDDYNTLANNLTDIINELNEKLRNIENFK